MSEEEEKVCLTAGQLENIGKAYSKNFPAPKKVCPKADAWVKGFFGKKKKKSKKEEKDPLEKAVERGIVSRINKLLDGFF